MSNNGHQSALTIPKPLQQSRLPQSPQGSPAWPTSLYSQPLQPPSRQLTLLLRPKAHQPLRLRNQPEWPSTKASQLRINLYVGYTWYWAVLPAVDPNTGDVRQVCRSPTTGLPRQAPESQSRSPSRGIGCGQKARSRGPKRRGTEEKALAVSFLSIWINFKAADYT